MELLSQHGCHGGVQRFYRHASAAIVIAGEVAEQGFRYLRAPVKLVTALDTSVPYSETLERHVLPSEEKIVDAVKSVLAMQAAAV